MNRTPFVSITPLVPSICPLAETIAFYRDWLGFTVEWETDDMAGIARDAVRFNVLVSRDQHWADNASYSIGVGDLDALYDEIRTIDARISGPAMRPWGRREVHLIDRSGVCLQFYQVDDRSL